MKLHTFRCQYNINHKQLLNISCRTRKIMILQKNKDIIPKESYIELKKAI